ncbi:MAG: MoxR family ATPase [Ilumatobacteraceae bacterium]
MTALLTSDRPLALADAQRVAAGIADSISGLIAGRRQQIEIATATVLAGGHLLIEDIPGVGKTLLAQGIAAAVGGSFSRIQGTADLLPSDVIGSMAPNADGLGLHFRPGPLFANVVLFDELNRANARAQSALLEVLEEGHVTVDGVAHPVPSPFLLVATQNPVEMAGTYPLAEGVTDRFMAALSLGRATPDEEVDVLTGRRGRTRLADVSADVSLADVATGQRLVSTTHLADPVARYAVDILQATRDHPRVRLGASTRAGVAMIALARAFAMMDGRDHVAPHDVARSANSAIAHRLVVSGDRSLAAEIVADCLRAVAAPRR